MSRALMSSRAVTAVSGDLVKAHPEAIDRVGCAQYRPKPLAEANRAAAAMPGGPRASVARIALAEIVRRDRLHDDRARSRGEKSRGVAGSPSFPLLLQRRRAREIECGTGPCDDDDMRKLEQLAPAMPRGNSEERVGADDERKRPRGRRRAQLLERKHRVARTGPFDFTRVDFEACDRPDGKLDHREAISRRCDRLRAMRRAAGGNEAHRRRAAVRRRASRASARCP